VGYRSQVTAEDDRQKLDEAVSRLGVPYELFPCDPALADTAQFCVAYGFALDECANTIVVVGKAQPRVYVVCVVLAPHRLDINRAVKARLGTRKASFAGADETRELTGMEIGGVTPFGLPPDLPVWVDAAVMARPRVVLGGGSRNWKVIAAPAILQGLPNVAVVEGLAGMPG
jgi:prolyl-tRNA editing enzyme YbaK/EbsC (Cys-tRNA(Pro) deacylase)